MNFDFSDEQYLFRDTLRAYLGERLPTPEAAGRLGRQEHRALWSELADLGVFSILVPETFGGLGLGFVDLVLTLQEFGRHLIPTSVVDTLIATDAVVRYGRLEQQQALLPAIAAGRMRIAVAASEVGGGDPARMATSISFAGCDGRLSGSKLMIAAASDADYLLVASRNGALTLIEPSRSGVELRRQSTLDVAAEYHAAEFHEVGLTERDLLGNSEAETAGTRLQDAAATSAAAMMTGISRMVLERVVDYVKHRVQFGRPVGSFQAIKHRCADMAVSIESSDAASCYAAWALATDSPEQAKAVSIAKSYCGDTARTVCNEGIQLHGGMGFTWDMGLHFYLRRVKVLEQMAGDATDHRRRLFAESVREVDVNR